MSDKKIGLEILEVLKQNLENKFTKGVAEMFMAASTFIKSGDPMWHPMIKAGILGMLIVKKYGKGPAANEINQILCDTIDKIAEKIDVDLENTGEGSLFDCSKCPAVLGEECIAELMKNRSDDFAQCPGFATKK